MSEVESIPEAKLWVGMDVHKDTVMIAVFRDAGQEPIQVQRLPNDHRKLRRFFERISRDGRIHACYEASGAGFVLHRAITGWGHDCEVIAPSLIPTRAGERRKHDRGDAIQLARLYRAGELVVIRVPTETQERVRDLVRCRNTLQREVLKSRQYILKFLTRRSLVFRDGTNWTQRHLAWLERIRSERLLEDEDAVIFDEYLSLLSYKLQRRDELDRKIEEIALSPLYRTAVERLCAFRGIKTHSAMVLISEIGDFRRFESPRQLMAYLGLVPSEHSSGDRERRGSITKAGNSHCRHVFVQAAWSARRRPAVKRALKERQRGQPASVVAHSWKAQQRLYKLFHRIHAHRPSGIAAVAVAREMVGFIWAVMHELEVENQIETKTAA